MAVWITSDGAWKVETESSSHRGQYVVWTWESAARGWVWKTDIYIPLYVHGRPITFKEQIAYLTKRLSDYLTMVDLIECDNPDWGDEAMEVKNGRPTA